MRDVVNDAPKLSLFSSAAEINRWLGAQRSASALGVPAQLRNGSSGYATGYPVKYPDRAGWASVQNIYMHRSALHDMLPNNTLIFCRQGQHIYYFYHTIMINLPHV